VVLPDSHEIPRAPCYSGHARKPRRLRIPDCHRLRSAFPDGSAASAVCNFPPSRQRRPGAPPTPRAQRLPAMARAGFSLIPFRSPLLRESRLLSLPAGTEMFHFPALPPAALSIQAAATAHDGRRVPPFGNPRITAWLPAPRGISQAPASFIGSWCQGIHRVPCKTWPHNCTYKMLASTVQFSRNGRRRPRPPRRGRQARPAEETPRTAPGSLRTQQRAPPRAPPPPPGTPAGKGKDSTRRTASAPPRAMGTARGHPPRAAPALLRKEVIQPHLPVRLPCYDFVPIADPTFDGSLPLRG
jgi:hypothetical protein